MTDRIKWTERRFDFTFPAGLYPEMMSVFFSGLRARAAERR